MTTPVGSSVPKVQMNTNVATGPVSNNKPIGNVNPGQSTMSSAAPKQEKSVMGWNRWLAGRAPNESKADVKAKEEAAAAKVIQDAAKAKLEAAAKAKAESFTGRLGAAVSSVGSGIGSAVRFVGNAIKQTVVFIGKVIAFPFVMTWKAITGIASGISSVFSSLFNAVFGKKADAAAQAENKPVNPMPKKTV